MQRVITNYSENQNKVKAIYSWLEVPFKNKPFEIIIYEGHHLRLTDRKFSKKESETIKQFIKITQNKDVNILKNCIDSSIIMHSKLPKIDKVAWDWIPTRKVLYCWRVTWNLNY